ncbi:MAG: bi-domain-containing oxidoreductase [Gemmatimonadaceae bacterium]
MIHLLQSLRDGSTRVITVPVPRASGAQVVVESRASVLSAGTERMLVDFGKAGLLEKARQQPEKVRQVLDKVRTDGLGPTIEAVRAKLDSPIPLGYCQAGTVVEIGPRVNRFVPGDRVVTNGPHAEYVRVAQTLAARIPDSVGFESAAFTPLAAIGLQSLRLATPALGETVVVYGLGLIGLLTVQLVVANGCRAIGIDRSPERVAAAEGFGARGIVAEGDRDVAQAVLDLTAGIGADIVLLTLATESDEPVHAAATMARKRGRIVLVGVAGLSLKREDFYRKELSFQVSCSYGPGRYDPVHEEQGVDYPEAFVRWTEGRNFAAVLDLMASGKLDPLPLISHRFPVEQAERAYDALSNGAASLGIVLSYPVKPEEAARVRTVLLGTGERRPSGESRVGWIGSGNFASRILIPAFSAAGAELEVIASSGGLSAAVVGSRTGFRRASTDVDSVLSDPAIDTVVITTRHDSHASLALRALAAGKNVFVEKPLALELPDVNRLRMAIADSRGLLCVGFNRRFAPMVLRARSATERRNGPLVISITVNAGAIPSEHWTQDREAGGGRIVGEACHFIDLARFFASSAIAGLQIFAARNTTRIVGDTAVLQLVFENGSVATIQYLSNGHRAFPKERVELFFDGRVIRIDNFRKLVAWGVPELTTRLPQKQDKGHSALATAFLAAVKSGGPPPIPYSEVLEVSEWAIRAEELASAGGGTA